MDGQQVDLFLDTLVDALLKDERAIMEFPFFSLRKRPRRTPMVCDDGAVKIKIFPSRRRRAPRARLFWRCSSGSQFR